jgi:hypothetical protein
MTKFLKATVAAMAIALAAAAPSAMADTQLIVQADKAKPLPIPQGATDLGGDPARGAVEYKHTALVLDISAFYVREMTKLGYSNKSLFTPKETIVVHDFMRNGKRVSVTILRAGAQTTVRARGDDLIQAAAGLPPVTTQYDAAAPKPAQASEPPKVTTLTLDQLTAEPNGSGWPVPKPNVNAGRGAMPGMIEATARVKTDVATLAAFYRRELPKLKWTEKPGGTDVKQNWTAPEGAVTVEILSRGDESEAVVTMIKAKGK